MKQESEPCTTGSLKLNDHQLLLLLFAAVFAETKLQEISVSMTTSTIPLYTSVYTFTMVGLLYLRHVTVCFASPT